MTIHPSTLCRMPRIHQIEKRMCVFLFALMLGIGSILPSPVSAQSRTEFFTRTDQVTPDGDGFFSTFQTLTINDAGQMSFFSSLRSTSGGPANDTGIFHIQGNSTLQIAREGQTIPSGLGRISSIGIGGFNNAGQTGFRANLSNVNNAFNSAILTGSENGLVQVAQRGQVSSNFQGSFDQFLEMRLDHSGRSTFVAVVISGTSQGGVVVNNGIFQGSGGEITQRVRSNQAVPGGNGVFNNFSSIATSNPGHVAFISNLLNTSGGASDNTGLFLASGNTISQIARKGQAISGGGIIAVLGSPVINDQGQVAFSAGLNGTSGSSNGEIAIFRGNGGNLLQVVRTGQNTPTGNGTYSTFGNYLINNSNDVAFVSQLTGTNDNLGLFRRSGGVIEEIVRSGRVAPGGNGRIAGLSGNFDFKDSGHLVFTADLAGTSGGQTDNSGIFAADGIDFLTVARKGDVIDGRQITSLTYRQGGTNQFGQVAYVARFSNGDEVISRWTPDVRWRANAGGNWDSASNWTLGLNPALVHDVLIDPAASIFVNGSAINRTVRSLRIGGGNGLVRFDLRNGSVLTALNGVTVESTATLSGDGIISGNLINRGTILANNVLVAGLLTNQNAIRGSGRIHANIFNSLTGRIQATNGDRLLLTGSQLRNVGLIEIQQGEMQINAIDFSQSSTGLVSLQRGTLIVPNGLSTNGRIAITQGPSVIQGSLHNAGTIQVSGDASLSIFGNFHNNGTLELASVGNNSSSATIFGSLSGSGQVIGGGDLFVFGDFEPGNSTASIFIDGNLFLSSTTNTQIELGGMGHGQFDQFILTGDLNLDGNLFVLLMEGHELRFNQEYLIGEVGGSLTGQFFGLDEGALVGNFGGIDLFITYNAGTGNSIALFTAVPESSAGFLTLLAASCWGMSRPGRRRVKTNRRLS